MPDHALIEGSYRSTDITFLLKRVALETTPVDAKEAMIQSGRAHYSEMLSQERRPDRRYLDIFRAAQRRGEARIAREISGLARLIISRIETGDIDPRVTLCSLVRAGVPYGVLLYRELVARGVDAHHYGISIIRDRGLDNNAMHHILAHRPPRGVIFVDGWTGKGAIANELRSSWHALTGRHDAELAVLADPSGFATMSGSHDDWLIPSGILGANVSGLISRSVLNPDVVGPQDFHGSAPVDYLSDIDVSLEFVDGIERLMERDRLRAHALPVQGDRAALKRQALTCVNSIAHLNAVDNLNRIKPGIAEATRAVLRRKPRAVYIRTREDEDLEALVHLCQTDGVEMIEDAGLTGPYKAITLIEKTT